MVEPMKKPNVVFIISDQHRWDFMGYEKNGVTHTPNLCRIGSAGAIFRSVYCTSPLCSPSRAAIASGRYGMNTGSFTNLHELPPGTPSFVQQFRKAGYRTCAVGKTHMEIHAYDADYCSEKHRAYMDSLGWDETCEISGNGMLKTGIKCAYTRFLEERGKLDDVLRFYEQWHYFMDKERKGDPGFICHEWPLPEEFQETAFVAQRALEWLQKRDKSRPFFLHVGFAAPHEPIEPFPAFMDVYRNSEETLPCGADKWPDWVVNGRRGYRAMITQIDHYVGKIYDLIAQQGELGNTVFVYTADHGEMMGDFGRWGKCNFYEGSMRVPLIFACPGIQPKQDSQALAELLDIGKTLCELCSVEPHTHDQGRSLVPILAGQKPSHRHTIYAEMGCDRMLFDGRHKLMWGDPFSDTRKLGRLHLDKPVNIPPSPPRLYDLKEDPRELNDLARNEPYRETLLEMLEKLFIRINQNTQPLPNKSRGEYRPVRSTGQK
jgi:choline-sulfatase